MRHNRAAAFDAAIASGATPGHWDQIADDPSDSLAIAHRAAALRASWRGTIDDRILFLEQRCAGRRVLDIGCVAHDVARMKSPTWLHARLARVAQYCLGVDIHPAGIAEMSLLGFNALTHDLSQDIGPLRELGPFDVIIAGELIEHVTALDMLFTTAAALLTPDGQLVITTPNPWAPHRVRAGQLGHVWENVDHILLAFPSGIAELADRHGLLLAEASTTSDRGSSATIEERAKRVKRWLLGTRWLTVGISSIGPVRPVRIDPLRPVRFACRTIFPRRRFLGETFIYVVKRPPT